MTNTPRTESTPEGEHGLVPGFAPVTLRDRLMVRWVAHIAPNSNPDAAQKTRDIGLATCPRAGRRPDPGNKAKRVQHDLIDFQRANDGASTPTQPRRTDPCNSPISHSTN